MCKSGFVWIFMLGSHIVADVDSNEWRAAIGVDNHCESVIQFYFVELNHR